MPQPLTTLKGRRVAIAGAGLAGLVAARDLAARGADVHVVEARARIGGRVWTDHEFGGGPLELGGEFVDGEHHALRSLCKELKVELQPVLKEGFGLALDVNGRVQIYGDQKKLWREFQQTVAFEAEAFRQAQRDWNSATAQLIGRHSLQSLLTARSASREVVAMAQTLRGFFLADPEALSALVAIELALQPTSPGHVPLSRIKGGSDCLVHALAKQSRVKVSLQSVITRIEQDEREARLVVADGSKRGAVIKADYLIVTLPATVVRAMTFTPAVPAALKRAWQALTPGAATKAHVQFDKAWWRKFRRPRAFGSNLDTGALWESGTDEPTLTMLAGGSASQGLRRLLEDGGPQRVIRRLSWLGEPHDARDFRSVTWELDPFARGAYAVFGPDFKPEWRAELSKSFGRIAFAGDHTSRQWQGYMNGAVESGHRAAREIELASTLTFNF